MIRLESGADPLLAGLVGSSATLKGSDPGGFAVRTIQLWQGATEEEQPASVSQAGLFDGGITDRITDAIGGVVNRGAFLLLGVVVVAIGLYVMLKD
jgi:hypothetical protein